MTGKIKAVLFDVGGPLDTEMFMDAAINEQIKTSFRDRGFRLSDDEYAMVAQWAVDVYAPKTYQAIIWRLAKNDLELSREIENELYETVPQRNAERGYFELRPGITELLEELNSTGLKLGLAANQPRESLDNMERVGILKYFEYKEVSGTNRLRKPDPRLMLHSCEALGVQPNETIMVGDRLDNDIVPARSLGMLTIRLRTGRHVEQKPRTWLETPHADVTTVDELRNTILEFVESPPLAEDDGSPE